MEADVSHQSNIFMPPYEAGSHAGGDSSRGTAKRLIRRWILSHDSPAGIHCPHPGCKAVDLELRGAFTRLRPGHRRYTCQEDHKGEMFGHTTPITQPSHSVWPACGSFRSETSD